MRAAPVVSVIAMCAGCAGAPGRADGPRPDAVYAFPLKVEDLLEGERISTGSHGAGIQALAKDLNVLRPAGGGGWTALRPGAPGDPRFRINADWLIHGKPFYAMADGEVIGCWRNAPENPRAGATHAARVEKHIPGGGNCLVVRHDDGVVAGYAHALPGSIPSELCPHQESLLSAMEEDWHKWPGVPRVNPQIYVPAGVSPDIPADRPRVRRGQFLGRVGNSGASSAPHLHVDMVEAKGGQTVPHAMRFERGVATDAKNATVSLDRWVSFAGRTLPDGPILVWPAGR